MSSAPPGQSKNWNGKKKVIIHSVPHVTILSEQLYSIVKENNCPILASAIKKLYFKRYGSNFSWQPTNLKLGQFIESYCPKLYLYKRDMVFLKDSVDRFANTWPTNLSELHNLLSDMDKLLPDFMDLSKKQEYLKNFYLTIANRDLFPTNFQGFNVDNWSEVFSANWYDLLVKCREWLANPQEGIPKEYQRAITKDSSRNDTAVPQKRSALSASSSAPPTQKLVTVTNVTIPKVSVSKATSPIRSKTTSATIIYPPVRDPIYGPKVTATSENRLPRSELPSLNPPQSSPRGTTSSQKVIESSVGMRRQDSMRSASLPHGSLVSMAKPADTSKIPTQLKQNNSSAPLKPFMDTTPSSNNPIRDTNPSWSRTTTSIVSSRMPVKEGFNNTSIDKEAPIKHVPIVRVTSLQPQTASPTSTNSTSMCVANTHPVAQSPEQNPTSRDRFTPQSKPLNATETSKKNSLPSNTSLKNSISQGLPVIGREMRNGTLVSPQPRPIISNVSPQQSISMTPRDTTPTIAESSLSQAKPNESNNSQSTPSSQTESITTTTELPNSSKSMTVQKSPVSSNMTMNGKSITKGPSPNPSMLSDSVINKYHNSCTLDKTLTSEIPSSSLKKPLVVSTESLKEPSSTQETSSLGPSQNSSDQTNNSLGLIENELQKDTLANNASKPLVKAEIRSHLETSSENSTHQGDGLDRKSNAETVTTPITRFEAMYIYENQASIEHRVNTKLSEIPCKIQ